jgi:hypothetical protein
MDTMEKVIDMVGEIPGHDSGGECRNKFPVHVCTPYCDGQRYGIGFGIHVIDSRYEREVSKEFVIKDYELEGWIVLGCDPNFEPLPRPFAYCGVALRGPHTKFKKDTKKEFKFAWLVTVKLKEHAP